MRVRDSLFDIIKALLMYFVICGHLQAANIIAAPAVPLPSWYGAILWLAERRYAHVAILYVWDLCITPIVATRCLVACCCERAIFLSNSFQRRKRPRKWYGFLLG